MCNIFDGMTLNIIHDNLYLWHGNIESFEFVEGRRVDVEELETTWRGF